MNSESDVEFKDKFTVMLESLKSDAGKTSSVMRMEKRDRIIRCLQNPETEKDSKFRSRVKERKYRLLQNGADIFLGVPDESSGELVYRRAACLEEFWDIIHAAHVENGHIGVVHTYAAIRRLYGLLPRFIVSKYIHMCPVCRHSATMNRNPKIRKRKLSVDEHSALVMIETVEGGENGENTKDTVTAHSFVTTTAQTVVETDAGQPAGSAATIASAARKLDPCTVLASDDATLKTAENITSVAVTSSADGQTTIITVQQADETHDIHNDSTEIESPSKTASAAVERADGDIRVVFSCHICNMEFEKKLFYQRHIRSHKEHNPAIPFVPPYKPATVVQRIKQERRSFASVFNSRQIIIDSDMGVEASQGLMLAACRFDLSIVAVTCVSGVVSIENACNNALRIVRACNREDVPVFCGSERPLVAKASRQQDGLTGPFWLTQVDTALIKSEHAVSAMIRLINENPGRITMVCLGPLTNLALAIRLDPQLSKKLKDVYILGGNTEGRGDVSMCAEQNFHYDPEAAFAVLEEIPNITLLPYEVCERHKLSGDFFDSWVHLGTDKSEYIRQMGDAAWLHERQKNGYVPVGCYALALIADRTVALEKKSVYATVELNGALSRGMMVIDWAGKLGCELNVDLVRSLDLGKIQSLLNSMVEEAEAMQMYTT